MSYSYYITPEEFEIAQQNGISPTTLIYRVKDLAWSKKKAITKPPAIYKPLKAWRKLAESNGIPYPALQKRINLYGWDPMRAATEPLQDRVELARLGLEARRKKRLEATV